MNVPPQPQSVFVPNGSQDILALRGLPVAAFGIASGDCQGMIQAVLVQSANGSAFTADAVIVSPNGDGVGQHGDSGMLWHSERGIVAQHALGNDVPGGQPSAVTVSTFVCRIQSKLGIRRIF